MRDSETQGPNPVDSHVGARVRIRRKMLGMSQQQLADALGLTFQQVQKYERGANRISASKLYGVAKALQVPVAFFFDGLADTVGDGEIDEAAEQANLTTRNFLMTAEGLELAELFTRLGHARVRRQLLDLVRAMAHDA